MGETVGENIYNLYKNPFLLQNHKGGCISIGAIPLPPRRTLHFLDISSLVRKSTSS
jgi:hypothetical protein